MTVVVRKWPLVGRDEELGLIAATMHGGSAGGMVLAGAAGVGKSRLAAQAVQLASSEGWRTYRAVATKDAARIPFGAVAHLIPSGLRPGADRLDILRQLAGALTQTVKGSRVLISVDDAHLLDAGTAALVHQLARTNAAAFQGLGLTYTRDGLVIDRLAHTQRRILQLLKVPVPWPERQG